MQLGVTLWEILAKEGSQPPALPGETGFTMAWHQEPSGPV